MTTTIDGVRRVSSLGGRIVSADSTMTLDDQDTGLRIAAETAGYRLGEIFDAVDESGFTFAGSPLMNTILGRVETGESAGVAFAYFDRNGRNWWEQGPFFKRLEAADGAYVVRGMEAIDYRTQIGRQLFGSMAVASEGAHFAAKDKGNSIAEAIMTRKVPNRVPYGYRRNGTFIDGRLTAKVDEHRDSKALVKAVGAATVERIYRMRLHGYGIGAIVRALNADAIPGPRGGRWTTSTVSSMIKNPVYKGTIMLGRISGKGSNRRKGTNVRTAFDAAIAIVSEDDWRRAQTGVKVQRTGGYRAGVAGGVLACHACGGTLQVIGSGERRLYGCRRGDSKAQCPAPTNVTKQVADDYVDELVESALAGRVHVKSVDLDRAVAETATALEAAKNELRELPRKVKLSDPLFGQWKADLEVDVAAAQAANDEAKALAGRTHNLPSPSEYRSWSEERRNALARELVRVVVGPPNRRAAGRTPADVRLAAIRARFTPEFK